MKLEGNTLEEIKENLIMNASFPANFYSKYGIVPLGSLAGIDNRKRAINKLMSEKADNWNKNTKECFFAYFEKTDDKVLMESLSDEERSSLTKWLDGIIPLDDDSLHIQLIYGQKKYKIIKDKIDSLKNTIGYSELISKYKYHSEWLLSIGTKPTDKDPKWTDIIERMYSTFWVNKLALKTLLKRQPIADIRLAREFVDDVAALVNILPPIRLDDTDSRYVYEVFGDMYFSEYYDTDPRLDQSYMFFKRIDTISKYFHENPVDFIRDYYILSDKWDDHEVLEQLKNLYEDEENTIEEKPAQKVQDVDLGEALKKMRAKNGITKESENAEIKVPNIPKVDIKKVIDSVAGDRKDFSKVDILPILTDTFNVSISEHEENYLNSHKIKTVKDIIDLGCTDWQDLINKFALNDSGIDSADDVMFISYMVYCLNVYGVTLAGEPCTIYNTNEKFMKEPMFKTSGDAMAEFAKSYSIYNIADVISKPIEFFKKIGFDDIHMELLETKIRYYGKEFIPYMAFKYICDKSLNKNVAVYDLNLAKTINDNVFEKLKANEITTLNMLENFDIDKLELEENDKNALKAILDQRDIKYIDENDDEEKYKKLFDERKFNDIPFKYFLKFVGLDGSASETIIKVFSKSKWAKGDVSNITIEKFFDIFTISTLSEMVVAADLSGDVKAALGFLELVKGEYLDAVKFRAHDTDFYNNIKDVNYATEINAEKSFFGDVKTSIPSHLEGKTITYDQVNDYVTNKMFTSLINMHGDPTSAIDTIADVIYYLPEMGDALFKNAGTESFKAAREAIKTSNYKILDLVFDILPDKAKKIAAMLLIKYAMTCKDENIPDPFK